MAGARKCIEVSELSKRYTLGKRVVHSMLRERLIELVKRPLTRRPPADDAQFWALRDVSFAVPEGEVVGIIGRNGAGKSTLLKILSRITDPTEGLVKIRGRVASLLEVGVGFHPELSGRENIYLNGSILGMRKREIDRHFDAIVDFAGVEKFVDTQIKHYSSGMRLRLGFAVAAHLDPDVLIVDEVLAVGDVNFQRKCLSAMEGLRNSGRTVLFVSHSLAAVENLCSRGIWIDGGRVRMDGPAKAVIASYLNTFAAEGTVGDLDHVANRQGSGEIRYTRVEYLSPDGISSTAARSGDPLNIRLHYRVTQPVRNPSFGFRIYTDMGTLVTETYNLLHSVPVALAEPGEGRIELQIDALPLLPARYTLSLWATGDGGQPVYDGDVRVALDVEPANIYPSGARPDARQGIIFIPQRWRIPELAPARDGR